MTKFGSISLKFIIVELFFFSYGEISGVIESCKVCTSITTVMIAGMA